MVTISLLCFFLLFASQLATITAFVVDVPSTRIIEERRITNHRHHHRFSLSLALSQGFGRTISSSGKKKKNSKKKYNSKSQAYFPDVSGTTKLLLEWLDEEEVEGLESVEIGFRKKEEDGDGLLRGVFAKRDIQPGEYIMAVPFVSTLLVDESFEVSSSSSSTNNDDPSSGDSGSDNSNRRTGEPIVGLRFWQKFLNKSDEKKEEKYKAYLDCLPMTSDDPNFDSTPDFWSEKEIQQLEFPIVIGNMLSRKHAIAELVETPQQDNGNDNGNDNDDVPTSISTLQQACWIMQSRGFSTYKKAIDLDGNIGLLSRVVLIPFIDMLNHASRAQSNAEIKVIETKEYDESFYALVANQHIPKRTEIKINYGTGEETSLELFCRYGFLAPTVDDEFFLENQEKEKAALEMLLLPEGNMTTTSTSTTSPWSTSLKDDQDMIGTKIGRMEPMHSILSLRIYAKKLLLSSPN